MDKSELKKLRKDHKLTQKELANLLRVGLSTIQSWESGSRPISYANAELINSHIGTKILAGNEAENKIIKDLENLNELMMFVAENWQSLKCKSSVFNQLIEGERKDAITEFIPSKEFQEIVESIIKIKSTNGDIISN